MNKLTDPFCIFEDLLFEISYNYYASFALNREIKHISKEICDIAFCFYSVNNIHHETNENHLSGISHEPELELKLKLKLISRFEGTFKFKHSLFQKNQNESNSKKCLRSVINREPNSSRISQILEIQKAKDKDNAKLINLKDKNLEEVDKNGFDKIRSNCIERMQRNSGSLKIDPNQKNQINTSNVTYDFEGKIINIIDQKININKSHKFDPSIWKIKNSKFRTLKEANSKLSINKNFMNLTINQISENGFGQKGKKAESFIIPPPNIAPKYGVKIKLQNKQVINGGEFFDNPQISSTYKRQYISSMKKVHNDSNYYKNNENTSESRQLFTNKINNTFENLKLSEYLFNTNPNEDTKENKTSIPLSSRNNQNKLSSNNDIRSSQISIGQIIKDAHMLKANQIEVSKLQITNKRIKTTSRHLRKRNTFLRSNNICKTLRIRAPNLFKKL